GAGGCRCARSAYRGGRTLCGGGPGRSEAFSGRRRYGRTAEDVRSEEPVYSHRYTRVFPPGQPDVLIDQAGQLITEPVRLLPVAAQCRAGDAERMRYGHECGNWGG